jgi:hypothetical protein
MKRFKVLGIINGICLLVIGVHLLFLFLLSSHSLDMQDSAQLRMILEIIIFVTTAILLFKMVYSRIFLSLSAISLIDLFIELSREDKTTFFYIYLVFISLIFAITLFLIFPIKITSG